MSQIPIKVNEITLTAPARIHFGLFAIAGTKQFGGTGLMIEEPATVVSVCHHPRLKISGLYPELTTPLVERVLREATQSCGQVRSLASLAMHICVERSAPRHAGFGTGTQIALAVATAVLRALDLPFPGVENLTRMLGRGRRSAIGSYGFFQGGFLVDSGKTAGEAIAELELRLDFPLAWPIVLIRPRKKQGLSGQFEASAFAELRGGLSDRRERLTRLCRQELVPAIRNLDHIGFAAPLAEFNRISGEYFAAFQHGAYNGPVCAQIVEDVRCFGVNAVGQSSWGPCIFAIPDNDVKAKALISHLRKNCPAVGDESKSEILITRANNSGRRLQHNFEVPVDRRQGNPKQRMT